MKLIEETHSSFKKIIFFNKPINEQLFSWRNGYKNVIPEEAVINYLQKHTIDKKVLRKIIIKYIDEKNNSSDTNGPMINLLEELGLDEK